MIKPQTTSKKFKKLNKFPCLEMLQERTPTPKKTYQESFQQNQNPESSLLRQSAS